MTIKIKDADLNNIEMLSSIGNNQFLNIAEPFELAVMMGKLAGYSTIDKFGFNPSISGGNEDVWEGGGVYPDDVFGIAAILSVASSSILDNSQTITITGLDIDGYEVVQNVNLSGRTRVALSTPLWRVYRMENISNFGEDLDGTVFCYTGTGTVPTLGDSEIRALIDNGYNQTQQAIYTVPRGYVGFLYLGETGIELDSGAFSGNEYARIQYKSKRLGKVEKIKKTITAMMQGSSNYQNKRSFPDIIPDLTELKLSVGVVSTTMGVWGSFDILLVEASKFSDEYLERIGQFGY